MNLVYLQCRNVPKISLFSLQPYLKIITPIIKQPGLDPSAPSSYRPIANVTFMSKIIEKLVASQMLTYLDSNNLLPSCQSGFRKGHPTESLLLHLLSDIYGAMDKTQLILMALFDVSAAVDSVDHDILLRRLSITFGINDLPLAWIASYFSERSASVLVYSSRSSWCPTPFGLPQGSVPILCILLTVDIGPLRVSCSLASHSYSDVVQAYKHCPASQVHSAVPIVSRVTDILNAWMSSNRLLLNPQKSQYIWFSTRQQTDKLDLASLSLEFPTCVCSSSVRDLGVILDQKLSFVEHITLETRSCFFHFRRRWVVSRSLPFSSTVTLVHVFIVNRVDHCSSLSIVASFRSDCNLWMVFLERLLG